jgi:nucleotide-binding universal stress UspA family protein
MGITSVYVPLDGSARAETALRPGLELASRCDAEVVLVAAPWPDTKLNTIQRYLDAHVAFAERPNVRSLLVEDRAPADAICSVAVEPGALVCMSTRGRGATRQALFGGVGAAVLRAASRPLLFVGPAFDPGWRVPTRPVVIAGVDGSSPSVGALRDAGDLAATLDGQVRVLQVLGPSDVSYRETPDAEVFAAFDRTIASLHERGVRVESVLLDGFDPAKALISEADHCEATFVTVASSGRSGLARVMVGSVTADTVRRAACPVLVSGPRVQRDAIDEGERSASR